MSQFTTIWPEFPFWTPGSWPGRVLLRFEANLADTRASLAPLVSHRALLVLLSRLLMELYVPAANDALRSDLAHCTGHRDTKLIARARLAVVFHRHAEGATGATGAGEQDRLR